MDHVTLYNSPFETTSIKRSVRPQIHAESGVERAPPVGNDVNSATLRPDARPDRLGSNTLLIECFKSYRLMCILVEFVVKLIELRLIEVKVRHLIFKRNLEIKTKMENNGQNGK